MLYEVWSRQHQSADVPALAFDFPLFRFQGALPGLTRRRPEVTISVIRVERSLRLALAAYPSARRTGLSGRLHNLPYWTGLVKRRA